MDKGVEVEPEQCPHVRSISCFTNLADPDFGVSFIKILWEVGVWLKNMEPSLHVH